MSKYSVDIAREGNEWVAVIPDLLAVGRGADAATALSNALQRAEVTEQALLETKLAARDKAGRLNVKIGGQPGLASVAAQATVGFGLRAAIVGVLLLVFYFAVASDIKTLAREFKNDLVAQVSLFRNAVEGTAPDDQNVPERLRMRAERLREILTPAARELRPIVRMLSADDTDAAAAPTAK